MKSVLIVIPVFGLVFAILWLTAPTVFTIGAIAVALLVLREYYVLVGCPTSSLGSFGLPGMVLGFLLLSQVLLFPELPLSASIALSLMILFSILVLLGRAPDISDFRQLSVAAFGLLYVVLPFASLISIRLMPQGRELVTSLILTVWARELGAGLGGLLFPQIGHPINAELNQKKTYLGAFVGMCAAILMGAIATHLFQLRFSLLQVLVWGLAIGVVCQMGDLSGSYLKRMVGKRHSSAMLGPRGGLLDIVDAFAFATIVAILLLSVWHR